MDDRSIEFDNLLSVSREKAMKNREEARNYISIDLGNLARILSQYHPLEIIKMAYWEERRVDRTTRDESVKEAARLMPVVLQSVVQSTLFKPHSYLRDVRKKDWTRVQSICQDIQRKLNRYIDFMMVSEYLDGRISRDNLERYNRQLHRQFFAGAVKEDKIHMKTEFAVACMEGESNLFRERYGLGRHALGEEIEKIVRYSINCIDDLRDSSSVHKTMMLLTMANLKTRSENADKTDEELRLIALKQPELYAENKRLEGLRDDYDMFRPDFVSDLPTSFYRELSAAPGTLDMDEYLFEKGMWPSAAFPFVDFGGLYFTFMGKSLLGLTQMILKTRFNLGQRLAVATEAILSSVLRPTDVDGVYSYEGEKIDVETLCPLGEVNAYRFPELFQSRSERRKAEMVPHAMPGHIALILDPDGTRPLEKLESGAFFVSLAYLLSIRNDRDARIAFYRTILPEAGIDKLDEKLDLEDLEDDIIAPPVEDYDVPEDELTLNELDEPETIEDDVVDDLDEDESVPEVSRYEVPVDEIRENERIYLENREVIEASSRKEKERDYEDRDLLEDYYQSENPAEDYSDEEEDEEEIAEHELDLTLEEEEEIAADGSDELLDDEDDAVEDFEHLSLLEEFDDEDLVDDTDEDEVFSDEPAPVAPVEDDVMESEIEEEKRDDDDISPAEDIIAPVENDVIGEEIETEERDDDEIEEETGDFPETAIVEPVRDDSLVTEEHHETYAQDVEREKYVPDPDIMRKLFGLDDEPEQVSEPEEPARDEEDEENETVASFFDLDADDVDDDSETEESTASPAEDDAESFGLSEDDDNPEDDVNEDEGPTFVLDDPSLVDEEKSEETASQTEVEDAGFTLIDPDEEEEVEETTSSILLGGSEVVEEEPETSEDDETEAEDEQEELMLFDETPDDSLQIPEISDVVDLKCDDDMSEEDAVAATDAEASNEELSGEGDTLNGDIVLEYYDEEEDSVEEESESVASEVVLSDEEEADASERVFTLSEEDVRENTPIHAPAEPIEEPEEEGSDETEDEEVEDDDEARAFDLGNPKYNETIRQIASLLAPELGVFGSFIEGEERPVLDYFTTVIRQCWERQCQDGRDKMFSIGDYDMSILLAKSKLYDALRENELMNNAGGVMYAKGKEEWNALILYVNKDFVVESVELRKITRDDFSASNWKIVTVIGEGLIARGQK